MMKNVVKKLAGAMVLAGFLCMMFFSAQVFADEVSLETFITSMKTGEFELNEEAQKELIEAVNDGNHDKQMEIYEDYFDGGSSKKQPDAEDIMEAVIEAAALSEAAGAAAEEEDDNEALPESAVAVQPAITVDNSTEAAEGSKTEAAEDNGQIAVTVPTETVPSADADTVTVQDFTENAIQADNAAAVNPVSSEVTSVPAVSGTQGITETPVETVLIPTPTTVIVPTAAVLPAEAVVQPSAVTPAPTATPVPEIQKIEEALNITATDRGNAYKKLSEADFNALCKIVEAECTGEGEYGKLLVANVVLNRVSSPKFPSTVTAVITQGGQFQPVANGRYYSAVPTAETIAAVNRAISGENNSRGTLYFKSVRSHQKWGNKVFAFAYKNHLFFY